MEENKLKSKRISYLNNKIVFLEDFSIMKHFYLYKYILSLQAKNKLVKQKINAFSSALQATLSDEC